VIESGADGTSEADGTQDPETVRHASLGDAARASRHAVRPYRPGVPPGPYPL